MYKIDIEYLVPEFGEITLAANNEEDARVEAKEMFLQENPEAVDISIVKVSKL